MPKPRTLLLLGHTGKMGRAVAEAFSEGYRIVGRNSRDFDAADLGRLPGLVGRVRPDIVVNAAAFMGLEDCERRPQRALAVNTLFPKVLAELSREQGFLLVHLSTDAVFSGRSRPYDEDDAPLPLNMYGLTKLGAECFIQAVARRYYIVRMPLLFGESPKASQFLEKMLRRARQGGRTLEAAGDVVTCPTYSRDAARALRRIIERRLPSGVYHIANAGKASLYDLTREAVRDLGLDVRVRRVPSSRFPGTARRSACTLLRSRKLAPLRGWKQALRDYCGRMGS